MRFLLILATVVTSSTFAQPHITWQKYFGNSTTNSSWANSIIQLGDSGFLFQARINSGASNKTIVRTDKYGDTILTRNYDVYASNIISTFDDGFLIAGGLSAVSKIIKLTSNYDTVWSKSFIGMTACVATQCRDSGYVLAGASRIIKTDPLGNVVWQKNLAGSYGSVIECFNGDILAVGMFGYYKYIATLLDSTGTIKWQKIYSDFSIGGGGGQFGLHGAVQLPDSNFLVVANNDKKPFYANCGGFDLAKIDFLTGDTIWTKQFPTFLTYTYIASISKIKDDYAFVSIGDQLFKIDLTGNIIWIMPAYAYSVIHSVTTCSDGGAAFAGAYLFGGPQTQYLAAYAKLDSLGNIYNFQSVPELAINELRVYPNPASHQLTINHLQLTIGKPVTVTVYDVMGKVHLQQTQTAQGDVKVELNTLPSGMYLLQVQQADRLFTGRFVKE
jgi:hypothetical protein